MCVHLTAVVVAVEEGEDPVAAQAGVGWPSQLKRHVTIVLKVRDPAQASLSRAFLGEIGAETAGEDDDILETTLAAVVERAEQAWPSIRLDRRAFVTYLARRLPDDGAPLAAQIERVHIEDLYLASACAALMPVALETFEARHLRRIHLSPDLVDGNADEVKQLLRQRLFMNEGDDEARIAAYAGRAPLAVWVRMCATRLALNLRRSQKRRAETDVDGMSIPATTASPELAYLKSRHGPELDEVFRQTIAALDDRSANLVRLHLIDGLGADEIGRIYRVSARTVQRWLAQVRAAIIDETRRLLKQRLKLDDAELESLLAVLQSQVDLGVSRILQALR